MDLAVRHLASQGHRRIGLAVGPDRFVPVIRKIDAFKDATEEFVDEAKPPIVRTIFTVEGGRAAGTELIADGCTAIVCASDMIALGVVRAAQSAGLRIPDDISIVGYDDSPLMAFTDPPLTTVRQPVTGICQAAVSSLGAMINGSAPTSTELTFVPELVVRRSTGAAPAEPPKGAASRPAS
jgi:DNA-binding LacI/PurR family transcriptional regulator